MQSTYYQPSSSPGPLKTPQKRKMNLSSFSDVSSLSGSSPPFSSPLSAMTERRRSQYKSHSPNIPSSSSASRRKPSALYPGNVSDKAMARKKFQDKCLERATKARRNAVKRKRDLNSTSSFDDAMDEDERHEDEEEIMRDEFFCRIVQSANQRTQYQYAVSFEREVGSPLDPDRDDFEDWEEELRQEPPEWSPEEQEIAELEAYAQECERQASLSEFDDIDPEELFFLDDIDGDDDGDAMDATEMVTS